MDERPAVRATVKWFNPEKGFGFVSPEDGTPDAFLHAKVVQSAGVMDLPSGSTVTCAIAQGVKGPQVTRLLEVDTSTATPNAGGMGGMGGMGGGRRPPRAPRDMAPRPIGERADLDGQVKWFNATRGFGFVVADDGGKDVFVHVAVLQRCGLTTLDPGQRVRMAVVPTAKGREAQSIEILAAR
jgi:CspA family cold shock protein